VLALTDEVYAEIREEIARALVTEEHVAGQVSAGVAAAFRAIERNRDIFANVHPRAAGAEIRRGSERLFAPYYALVADAIRAGQECGEIPTDLTPDLVARLVVEVIDSAAYAFYVLGDKSSVEAYQAEVTRFIQRGLGVE
jgi:Tetracyclin repressor-like, C-terminal domain